LENLRLEALLLVGQATGKLAVATSASLNELVSRNESWTRLDEMPGDNDSTMPLVIYLASQQDAVW
jgi:hypothetical protein